MELRHVVDGIAVGDHIALEVPVLAQPLTQQPGQGADRRAADGVVRTHDRSGVGIDDGCAKRGEIRVFKVMRRWIDIEAMAAGFRPAVHGEVLWRGDHRGMQGIAALKATDESTGERGSEGGVLAVGFLPAAPAWVAEDIDIGRPER